MPRVRVTDLFIYPVKSLGGIALSQTSLTYRGLLYDRRWMIVREDNGQFVSQRQLPRMCLINTRLGETHLTLSSPILMPGEAEVKVDINGPRRSQRQASVWRDECRVVDMGDEVALWLNHALNSPKPLRLVAMAPDFRRLQSQPERFGQQAAIFADAAPFLIANRDSLEVLNQHLAAEDKPLARIEQFRPNIVIAGLSPFSEHSYSRLHSSGGNYTLQLHDRCERCSMVNINPTDGSPQAEQEPYRTLAHLNPMPDKPQAAAFGENASLSTGDGQNIGVGDWLSIDRELQTTS
ncbi:MAG: MOSC N-terminal beta barrel domain-containing protein [Cellvibrionaceae bacterium]|nr:MOSC N-terminal beta barrel domain-containing protein [Cellvibrionaceae bacterium]